MENKQIVLTYGTFDILHNGHRNLFKKCKEYGDYLIVGVTTPEFNDEVHDYLGIKRKEHPYESLGTRMKNVGNDENVDQVIVEDHLFQKDEDVAKYKPVALVLGEDMRGRYDYLNEFCKVIYVPRTEGVSSTLLRDMIKNEEA